MPLGAKMLIQTYPTSDGMVVDVYDFAAAVQPLGLRVFRKSARDLGECAGKQHVIAVDPAHDVAGGRSKPFVDRIDLTCVGLADPGQPLSVALEDFDRAIRTGAVDDAIIELKIALLREHAVNGALDEPRMVVRRRDDGNA